MEGTQDFESMRDKIQTSLVSVTRTVNKIASEDLGFQRSLNKKVGKGLDKQASRLLKLSAALLKSTASVADLPVPVVEDVDDVDNNWSGVVDVVDSLLEKADMCLDEYTGRIQKRDSPAPDQSSKRPDKSMNKSYRNQNLVKPQLAFNRKPDNSDTSPWKPLLKTKPHAKLPLKTSLSTFEDELQHKQYKHPYETEILELQYPNVVYRKADPIDYLPIEKTQATFVDTLEGVKAMLAELKSAKEIAIDLEHHDQRSYVGLVSLMQISTRKKDWIVDTLKPWREELQILNEVFADPNILKVFHGAYMDIVWLQRDLGLYVVGLFDTHHSCRVLGYPGGSLAYLLKRFVNFDADKKYQMADWRLRPLPEEMLHYARADTHYLLYIYDHLRNELLDKSDRTNPEENKIELVLQKSKETSLLRYSRQIYDKETGQGPGGWYNLLVKTAGLFSKEQFSVFRAIHAWRDQIARKDDDSTTYVMPNHTIFSVAKAMPEDMTQLYSVLHPISYNVKSRISDLLHVIKEAKEKGKDGPSMMDVLRADSVAAIAKHAGLQGDSNRSTPLPEPTTIVAENQDLRSNVSTFWGSAFGSSIWDSSSATVNGLEGIRLAVPMPDVLQETTVSAVENPVASTPVEPPTKEVAEDEPFTIKNGSSSSKKRKARDLEPSPVETPAESAEADGDGDYDISLHAPDEEALAVAERQAERKRRKKEKKAAKRAALESASGSTSATPKPTAGSTVSLSGAIAAERGEGDEAEDEDEEEEEAPFDYSSAPSVLHRKEERNSKGGKGEGKKGKGKGKNMGVNPYAKSANAMKGMRKVQSGTGVGKSHTFRK